MKAWLVIGKVFLSLLASMVGALLGDIIGHDVLNISPDPKSLTIAFIWVLIFPVWYPSKISFRLVATIVGPIVAFLFWSISLVIPVEAGSGMVLLAGGIKAGAFVFAMLVQFIIMRQGRVLPVTGAIYSEEKDDLSPELEDNVKAISEQEPTVGTSPVRIAGPWSKKLLIGWGVLTILWIIGVSFKGWYDYGGLLKNDIEEVRLDVEKVVPRASTNNSNRNSRNIDYNLYGEILDALKGKTITREWFSAKKLHPNSPQLAQVRNNFPSMKGMTDLEFSDHLWSMVKKESIKVRVRRSEEFKDRMLTEVTPLLIIPPIVALISALCFGSLITWGLRKYPPSELTPYTKKIIVASVVWIMGTISWFKVEEGLDDGEYVLVYILPPLLLIVASVLWKWANKSPTDVSPQPDADRAS